MSLTPSVGVPGESKERDLGVGCLALYETPLAVAVLPMLVFAGPIPVTTEAWSA